MKISNMMLITFYLWGSLQAHMNDATPMPQAYIEEEIEREESWDCSCEEECMDVDEECVDVNALFFNHRNTQTPPPAARRSNAVCSLFIGTLVCIAIGVVCLVTHIPLSSGSSSSSD